MSQEIIDSSITFFIKTSGQLLIPEHILTKLNHYRQGNPSDAEAGGILLGRQFENKSDIVVDEITIPFSTDARSRHRFYRSKKHHDYAVERWKKSEGTCLYLGLWHTHPEVAPIPSPMDFSDWTKAIKKGVFEGDSLFFIIIGTQQIFCWQSERTGKFRRFIGMKNTFIQLRGSHEQF